MASGGSYVVIYEADVELSSSSGVVVNVSGVEPADTDPLLVEEARSAILRGAEKVLVPLGKGAEICVHRLAINVSDFKPGWFERFTTWELQQLVGSRSA